jgi:3-oxoadipate enol-lactonase
VAEDTAGLVRALTIPRAHVLGVCMGGRIALARTLAHPERVEKLVLVSTSARTARRPWWVGPVTLLASGLLLRSRYPQPRDAFRRQREASSAFDCSERVPDIHAPTLILHGTADKTVPYALAECASRAAASWHRGLDADPLRGGHVFFRERARFLDTVVAFLER